MEKTYNLNWNIEREYDNSDLFCMQRADGKNFIYGYGNTGETYLYVFDLRILNTGTPTYEYSYDGTNWSDLPSPPGYGTANALVMKLDSFSNRLYLRAKNINPFHPWIFGLSADYVISGNLTYLVSKDGETLPAQDNSDWRDGYLAEAFYNVTYLGTHEPGKLVSAKRCFYRTNKNYIPCGFFWGLFKYQTRLKDCFKIQSNIDHYGCREMFWGCKSLRMLPTDTFNCIDEGDGCSSMFYEGVDVCSTENSVYHNGITVATTASAVYNMFGDISHQYSPGTYYTSLKINK